jgi:hypothetical protein
MSVSARPLIRALAAAAVCAAVTAPALHAQAPIGSPLSLSNRHTASNPIPEGKAYWQCKTDCTVKLETVAQVRAPEPPAAAPAYVPQNPFRRVPPQAVRRARAVLDDVMFGWYDESDRADHYRFGRPNGEPVVRKGGN